MCEHEITVLNSQLRGGVSAVHDAFLRNSHQQRADPAGLQNGMNRRLIQRPGPGTLGTDAR